MIKLSITYANKKEIDKILNGKKKGNKKWLLMSGISLAVAACCFGSVFVEKFVDNFNNNALNEEIQELVINDTMATNETIEATPYQNIDFNALTEALPNAVGWIECPGTVINYPVMQSDNNAYYLNHDAKGNNNSAGAIYLDYRDNANLEDTYNIIYGHNRESDDSMFDILGKYHDPQFRQEHPVMYYHTANAVYEMTVADISREDFNNLYNLNNTDEANAISEEMQKRASILAEAEINGDKIITLSSCVDQGEKSSNQDEREAITFVAKKILDKTLSSAKAI